MPSLASPALGTSRSVSGIQRRRNPRYLQLAFLKKKKSSPNTCANKKGVLKSF